MLKDEIKKNQLKIRRKQNSHVNPG
jgi:hypothetical protein